MTTLILGLGDGWVAAAILLAIGAAGLCAVYGLLRWNKGSMARPSNETMNWVREEDRIEEEL